MALTSLQVHTSLHFSFCHLQRLPNVRRCAIDTQLTRVLERPSTAAPINKLRAFFDVLYCFDGSQHQEKHGTTGFRMDNDALLKVANADVAGSRMVYDCHTDSGKLRCGPAEGCRETYTAATLNMCLAIDTILCESQWTNLLPNVKNA